MSMSFLGKLLDGVEVKWKALWEITTWDKKFNAVSRDKQPKVINYSYLLAVDLFKLEQEDGDIFLLSTGERTGWTTIELAGENLREGEVVAIPGGKSRPLREVIKYYKGRFVTADNRIATSNDTSRLLNKFLYYWMISQAEVIDTFYRGAGIQHPSMAAILDMEIPIPQLHIQAEIVRILDAFTALTTELTTELNARTKQYNYYRDKLLSFEFPTSGGVPEGRGGQEVEWKTLGWIGDVRMCKRILKNQTSDYGDIPFYKIGTFGKEPDAYIPRNIFEEYKKKYNYPRVGEILISASGTIGRAVIFNGEDAYFQDSNIVWLENDESKVLNKYLFYFYQIANWSVSDGGVIKRLYNDNIKKTLIQVPYPHDPERSLAEQARIVAILDKFNTLTHSITEGLPREIELRQKQYEYYRDRLLSFPQPKQVGAA